MTMTIPSLRRAAGAAVLLCAALLASCESPTGGDSRDPAQVDVVSGGLQQGVVGEELSEALVVRVLDDQGRPVAGQLVNFRVVTGGGSVFAGSALTGSDGIARDRWILGTVARDTQRVEARAVDQQTGQGQVFAVFRAVGTPAPAAAITPVTGAAVTGVPGLPVADSLGVRVADRFGNSIAGTTVAWTVTRGGGSVSPATSVTDTAGIARTQWVMGAWSDSTQTVQAAAGVALTTSFVASTGVPAGTTLAVVSGNGQTAPGLSALPQPLVVKLTLPDGRPVPGAPVSWSVSGGTITPSVSTTDAQGMAQAQWVLPSAQGTATATASTPGVMPAGFTVTVQPAPAARLIILGGDNQVGYSNVRLPELLAVRVQDAAGNDVWSASVTWEVVEGDGYFADVYNDRLGGRTLTTTTGDRHRVYFAPLGPPGTVKIRATSGNAETFFTEIIAATRIVLHSPGPEIRYGDSVWVAVDAYATTPITSVTARVQDREIMLAHGSDARYNGVLRLDGLPRGRYDVVITVNAQGTAPASILAPVILDRTPVVTVLLPRDSTVASAVRVHATCQDDDPGGCKQLRVVGTGLAGTSEIDGTLTFSGGPWTVLVEGVDSAGRVMRVARHGWSAGTAPWTQVAEVHGVRVLDANDLRVLYMTANPGEGGVAKVLNRATDDTVTLTAGALGIGRVTPVGALGFRQGELCCDLYDWRGAETVSRGHVGRFDGRDTIHVEGSWALWPSLSLMRQNLVTGAIEAVPSSNGRGFDLGENGDVVWATSANAPQIMRWHNGVTTALTVEGDGGHVNQRPKTDGVNTGYVRLYTDGPALVLNGPDDREILARPPSQVGADSLEFDLRDGWTAFRRWGDDGVPRLWMRSPAGAVQQASSQRLDRIRVMGPGGQVIFASGARMYYTAPPFASARDVGPAFYLLDGSPFYAGVRVVWPGQTPYALVGRYAFRIDL